MLFHSYAIFVKTLLVRYAAWVAAATSRSVKLILLFAMVASTTSADGTPATSCRATEEPIVALG